jgi:sortase (surface protein transpeptidase)
MTLVACGVFGLTFARATLYYQNDNEISLPSAPTTATVHVAHSQTPVRLIIPAAAVDAHVQAVGIGKSGNMAVPTNYTDVGWYRYGPAPGQVGSAVIDGHVDNGFGLSAVFKNISDLKPGDDMYVETASSTRLHFVVNDIEDYPAADVPKNLLFTRADAPRLNLITCAGEWDASAKAYDHRTVVYATLQQ